MTGASAARLFATRSSPSGVFGQKAAFVISLWTTRGPKMEAKAKLLGHPIHQMLIVLPLGLLTTAVVFDIVHLVGGGLRWTEVAYWLIGAGVVGGLLTAPFGLIDWLAIPARTRAKRVGAVHGLGNVAVVVLFLVSWLLRRANPAAPPGTAYLFSFLGFALA